MHDSEMPSVTFLQYFVLFFKFKFKFKVTFISFNKWSIQYE